MKITRRVFAKNGIATATSAILSNSVYEIKNERQSKKMKIVCVGAHPDDPESGCGGTLAKYAADGHTVVIIYLTSGEAGIEGVSHHDAAAIRTKEAIAACAILNARPVFAGQVDGDTVVNNDWSMKIKQLIEKEKPDIVFTHWPIDSHRDHQAASMLTFQSWLALEKSFVLYFFEVCTGSQTIGFKPTAYCDISSTRLQKNGAVYCHTSQNPKGIYNDVDCNHKQMETFRGAEAGCTAAEAFVKMNASIANEILF
jgi:LmbE family N-acetylglucosaminyl deacetylase